MNFFNAIESQIYGGGWVNIPLLLLAAMLFYLLGYRLSLLIPSLNQCPSEVKEGKSKKASLLNLANEMLINTGSGITRKKTEEIYIRIQRKTKKFSGIVNTLVSLAPLLGLLGTVIGMIETFSSLGDQSLFSSSGGIAGGISQALITTQVGLVIAIPGLFVSRFLKRIEEEVLLGTEQLIELYNIHNEEIKN